MLLESILVLDSSAPFSAEDFINKLIPNFWSFLINLIALIVLFVLLFFIAYKPLKKYCEARKDNIEKNMRDAERAKKINERNVQEGAAIIENAHTEAQKIIAKAKVDAASSAEAIITDANAEAKRRQKECDEALKLEEAKARDAIKREIVNVALDASKEILGREVSESDNAHLIDEFIAKNEGGNS